MFDTVQAAKGMGVDVEWACERRRAYLNGQINELRGRSNEVVQLFAGHNELERYLLLDSLRWLNGQVKRFELELNSSNKKPNDVRITQADIERARQYPLENLLTDIRHNKTNCISGSHEDKHPSMDIRNNFAYCYSCGWRGDAIAVFMKLHAVDFITAVKSLRGHWDG